MHSVLWQRLDLSGHDRAVLATDAKGQRIAGTALFALDGNSYDIRYTVLVDPAWCTTVVAAHVQGPGGDRRLSLRGDGAGRWWMGDRSLPDLDGCLDVDFAFTPATNTLPLRRLRLAVGEAQDVRAARVGFPGHDLEPVWQRYQRLAEDRYGYSSGAFSVELTVDPEAFVTEYPGYWTAVTRANG